MLWRETAPLQPDLQAKMEILKYRRYLWIHAGEGYEDEDYEVDLRSIVVP